MQNNKNEHFICKYGHSLIHIEIERNPTILAYYIALNRMQLLEVLVLLKIIRRNILNSSLVTQNTAIKSKHTILGGAVNRHIMC